MRDEVLRLPLSLRDRRVSLLALLLSPYFFSDPFSLQQVYQGVYAQRCSGPFQFGRTLSLGRVHQPVVRQAGKEMRCHYCNIIDRRRICDSILCPVELFEDSIIFRCDYCFDSFYDNKRDLDIGIFTGEREWTTLWVMQIGRR